MRWRWLCEPVGTADRPADLRDDVAAAARLGGPRSSVPAYAASPQGVIDQSGCAIGEQCVPTVYVSLIVRAHSHYQ